jgi:hypothetical protein
MKCSGCLFVRPLVVFPPNLLPGNHEFLMHLRASESHYLVDPGGE